MYDEVFNVGCIVYNYCVCDIVEIVVEVVLGVELDIVFEVGLDKCSYCVDFIKIEM